VFILLGAGSAMLGKEGAMACTVAVETVIGEHYDRWTEWMWWMYAVLCSACLSYCFFSHSLISSYVSYSIWYI